MSIINHPLFLILLFLCPIINGSITTILLNSLQNATSNSCRYTYQGIDPNQCKPFSEGFMRSAMYSVMSFNGSFGNVEFTMPISAPTGNIPLLVGKLMKMEISKPCEESSRSQIFPGQTVNYNPFWNLSIREYERIYGQAKGTVTECSLSSETLIVYDLNENKPQLNDDFKNVLNSLPSQYDDDSYTLFYSIYGFGVALVKYGGNRIEGHVKWTNGTLTGEGEITVTYGGWEFHQDRTYWLYRVYEKPSIVDFEVKRLSSFLSDYSFDSFSAIIENMKKKENEIIASLNK